MVCVYLWFDVRFWFTRETVVLYFLGSFLYREEERERGLVRDRHEQDLKYTIPILNTMSYTHRHIKLQSSEATYDTFH